MLRTLLLLWLAALMLGGCASTPSRPPLDEAAAQARKLEAAGDFSSAARLYLGLADSARSPRKEELKLQAVGVYIRGRQLDAARRLLELVQRHLPAKLRPLSLLRSAELAQAEGRSDEALRLIDPLMGAKLAADLEAELYGVQADIYLAQRRPLDAVELRVRRDELLVTPEARAANHLALWEAVQQLPDQVLNQAERAPPPDVLSGWLDLAATFRAHGRNRDELASALDAWARRYPNHPARGEFLTTAQQGTGGPPHYPAQIGLLLPSTGNLAAAAAAIRDGFLAAYYSDTTIAVRPRLRLYDVEAAGGVAAVYARAVADGAQLVVGPLTKERVTELAAMRKLTVPTLSLNYVPAGSRTPAGMTQFGLAPEDEARQLADRAYAQGHLRALALYPDSDWGRRVYQAFAQHWSELGGAMVGSAEYSGSASDYALTVQRLLGIDASEARHRALQSALRRTLKFEPRRRQDADFIAVIALPQQARQLRPLLRFYYADDLPAYATSHVYTGTPNPAADQDMDGLRFCEMPWVLGDAPGVPVQRRKLAELWPQSTAQYLRLYALGIDAYLAIPSLSLLERNHLATVSGATGILHMDAGRLLHRRLEWARFERGVPRILADQAGARP